ncbi:Fic family protein [Paramaledivibacter caminithermalis]|jgi:Fic family protein|uniref:Fic/DOC family protein n=1 Tax=Paramaledivibacter caminithermalis (strain DSM 15212 / CIP 107654 / DViRD3) TaxID=1121301 RepID=A0A1M6JJY5_PARC5|nr:Fic family protein [Paramaledivibacter caminithermalis]SHJ47037.1 Fic/DOC family protein [Paramaledivibacter caminithermalis DSM 15212]
MIFKNYPDKCRLSVKENIFHAKKIIIQNIYNSAKLEGCNVTFPETETILNGVNVSGVSISDIECIINLRNGWRYMLKTVEEPLTLEYICKIHAEVARNEALEWGVLRTGRVGISGTSYIPPVPDKEQVEIELNKIFNLPTATSRAIYYFLWATRNQLFWDGNKRTSTLIANKILISSGSGIFTVKENDLLEFNTKLSAYYENADYSLIDDFLYDNCIIYY